MTASTSLRAIGTEILAFLLAATCAGCGAPGTGLCGACGDELTPRPTSRVTADGLAVLAALPFDGIAARCIRSLKGDGQTALARPLAAALAPTLQDALADGALAVPIPTGRAAFRRRGYRVPELLIRRAGASPTPLLREVRRRADQRGLGARERARNVQDTLRARVSGAGRPVVLVDDVITTGATFDEGVRALTEAGFHVVCGVALAATPRYSEVMADPPRTRRK